jgi:pimeloyl-ACP methyl ester carboxylesterase
VELYSAFQQFFRERQPKLLAVWGKNDPSFIPPGAWAFKKDLPDAEVVFLDAGHFAAESDTYEISQIMLAFLEKNNI